MIELLHLSPVLMALCLLISLVIAGLVEKYGKKIPSALKYVSWNTFFKGFVVWTGILVLRKLIYYIPIDGVIQTKDTVWWIDGNIPLHYFILLFMALIMILVVIKGKLKLSGKRGSTINFLELMVIFGPLSAIYIATNLLPLQGILYFFALLLLSLKVICLGKYIGLFTSFVLAYYITNGMIFKKTYGKPYYLPIFLLIIGIVAHVTIPSGPSEWWDKFYTEFHDAGINQRVRTIEDLLDATDSIRDVEKKSKALGEIAAAIVKTGDIQWATVIAKHIPDMYIRTNALETIRQRKEKK